MNSRMSINFSLAKGLTLLEAVVATGMMAAVIASTFSVVKILSAGKDILDNRTNFYLASESVHANVSVAMMNLTASDITAFSLSYSTGSACPSNSNVTLQDKVQNALCAAVIPTQITTSANLTKSYRIDATNTYTLNGTTRLMQLKLSFVDPATNGVLFERLLQYVK